MRQQIIDAAYTAAEIHDQIHGIVSVDAIFLALMGQKQQPSKGQIRAKQEAPVPLDFREHVECWRGQIITASDLYQAINKEKPTIGQAKQYGTWLRALGYESKKSNGRLLFKI